MDRNQAIGLVLIAGILIVYSFVFKAPSDETAPVMDSALVETPEEIESSIIEQAEEKPITVLDTAASSEQYGVFAPMLYGESKLVKIETDLVEYTFNTKGGNIESVLLKEYKSYDGTPLLLNTADNNSQDWVLQTVKGNISTAELYFEVVGGNKTISGSDSTQIRFRSIAADGGSIEYTYNIKADKYDVDFNAKVNGLKTSIIGEDVTLKWSKAMTRYENNLEDSRNKTTITYYTMAEDFDELKAMSKEPEGELIGEPLKWASFNQKFFNAGIISENGFKSSALNTAVPLADTTVVKAGTMELKVPVTDLYQGANFTYFYGPKEYKTLKKVGYDYSENVYMGYALVSWVNKYILVELFDFLEGRIANYGVIIMIIVFLVKMVLFPLTRKSYLSMAKMKVLKPELDALKEKTGGDAQKMQQEQMALYRQVGVNPISGCLPMVLQMPILFAMFFFFPNAIELRQQSFLWATDLSTYDVLFNLPFTIPFYGNHVSGFTLLMTVSTMVYTWSQNQVSTVQGPMKNIGYFMPVIFMFVLNSYSSGLSFYYFVSNVVTFSQQLLIRRFVDDDKIRNTLMENKKKNSNKKKSKFQQRLEDAMKASQETQKQKQLQQKKKK